MKHIMRKLVTLSIAACTMGGATALQAGNQVRYATFEVKVQNVTANNAVSPFLLVAHRSDQSLFEVGAAASPGVAAIAETGDTSVLEEALEGANGVFATAKAAGGPTMPGKVSVARITVPYSKRVPVLTLLAMIGKSNDSFVSLNSYPLSSFRWAGQEKTVFAGNFDAGSEENTGNVEDFGPGGNPTDGAEGLVSYDRGLNLRGNAPESIAWGPKVARVTIKRIR
ncbi:MAG: hypothetical protein HRU19_20640 [Pseudobacteriovorax sp.]|nr:hypothetical protein [Pseudobacteriovorax sp.]